MASENHFILDFFASRNPTQVILKTIPLLILYVYVLFTMFNVAIFNKIVLMFFRGFISWSMFEYFVHRVFYHKRTKSKKIQWYLDAMHLHHHKNLKDYRVLNAGFLMIYPLTFFVLSLTYLIAKDIILVASFGLGMTLYYLFYEYIHYQIHYKFHSKGYLNFVQKYHLYHHYYNWNKNFGNTIAIWDKLFGTYDAKYKELELTKEQVQNFILKK